MLILSHLVMGIGVASILAMALVYVTRGVRHLLSKMPQRPKKKVEGIKVNIRTTYPDGYINLKMRKDRCQEGKVGVAHARVKRPEVKVSPEIV